MATASYVVDAAIIATTYYLSSAKGCLYSLCLCYTTDSMKQGGNRQSSRGFTMVEVLIVLAVTSALLVMAMVIISGRLQKTEFAVGSRQIRQDIEDVFNKAGSGFSGSRADFTCTVGGGAPQIASGGAAKPQGQNEQCIFVGNVIVFGTNSSRKENMRTIPLAGSRQKLDAGGQMQNVTTIKDAHPVAIAPTPTSTTIPDQSETIVLPRGFEFAGARVDSIPTLQSKFAVAVLSDLAGGEAQHFSVFGIDGWNPGDSPEDEAAAINAASSPIKYKVYQQIRLCFAHAGINQSAELTLGREGGLGIETAIRQGVTC